MLVTHMRLRVSLLALLQKTLLCVFLLPSYTTLPFRFYQNNIWQPHDLTSCPVSHSKSNENEFMIIESACDAQHTNLFEHFNGHKSNFTDASAMWLRISVFVHFI